MTRQVSVQWRCVAATMAAVMVAGCSPTLESFSALSPRFEGPTKTLTAAFNNALNLPMKAKVKLNGADIGEVTAIRARNFMAYVSMRVRSDAPLLEGTVAELRSATPLGDIFVALGPGSQMKPGAASLPQGATIPATATSAASTVEEVLSAAALMLNGGSVRHLVVIANGAGAAVGGRGEKIAALLRNSDALVSKLAARSGQINEALRGTTELAATVNARQSDLNETLAAAVPAVDALHSNAGQLVDLTETIGRITDQLNRFPSLAGTDTRSLIADLNRLSAAANDINSDPQLSLEELNRLIGIFMKMTNSTSAHANLEVPKLALGSLPDLNYPGDPAFHGPDGTDWHAMIGSLRYEWNVLMGKILGPQR